MVIQRDPLFRNRCIPAGAVTRCANVVPVRVGFDVPRVAQFIETALDRGGIAITSDEVCQVQCVRHQRLLSYLCSLQLQPSLDTLQDRVGLLGGFCRGHGLSVAKFDPHLEPDGHVGLVLDVQ